MIEGSAIVKNRLELIEKWRLMHGSNAFTYQTFKFLRPHLDCQGKLATADAFKELCIVDSQAVPNVV